MARPKKEEKLIPFTVMLQPKIVDEIKEMAIKVDMSAGKLARNMLLIGLDDGRLLYKAGVLGLITASRRQIGKIIKQMGLNYDDLDIFNEEK